MSGRSGFRDTFGDGGEDAFDRGGGDSGADASGFVIHDDDGEVSRVVTITKDGVYVGDAEGETVVNVNSDGIYAKSGEKKLNRRWVHKDENSDDWDEDGFLDDDDDDDDDFFDDDETDGDGKEFNVEMNFSGSKKKDGRFWMHFPYPILCAVAYLAMGFVWDYTTVKTEYTAVSNVNEKYLYAITDGVMDYDTYIDEYVQALKDAGIDKIIAEKQAQLDAWATANGIN